MGRNSRLKLNWLSKYFLFWVKTSFDADMKESLEENIISTEPPDFEFTFIITIDGPCQKCVDLIWNMNMKYIFSEWESSDLIQPIALWSETFNYRHRVRMCLLLSPVSPVVNLQPGEDGATGDQGARQHAEPVQVGGEQLPDRVLQHETQLDEYHQVWGREELVRRSR